MDASQYKDYVLVLLFIKYVSDKYVGQSFSPITIPPGAGFKDMVALKGKSDIGDQINKKILAPLASANKLDFPDFNEAPSSALSSRCLCCSGLSTLPYGPGTVYSLATHVAVTWQPDQRRVRVDR